MIIKLLLKKININGILPSLETNQRMKSKFNPTFAIDKVISAVTLEVVMKRDLIYSFLIFPIVYEMMIVCH